MSRETLQQASGKSTMQPYQFSHSIVSPFATLQISRNSGTKKCGPTPARAGPRFWNAIAVNSVIWMDGETGRNFEAGFYDGYIKSGAA
jgi:hypothetical protein